MEEITHEQKEQLKSWAGKRDAILLEISNLSTEKENLTKHNKDLVLSGKDIHDTLHQTIGRIEEVKRKEKEMAEQVNLTLAELSIKKRGLETLIPSMEKEIKNLQNQKDILVEFITTLDKTKLEKEEGLKLLDKVVGHVIEVSDSNITQLEQQTSILVDKVKEVVAISTENINKHNVILDEIPKLFVELRRKSLEREEFKRTKQN
jgi:hypothetical protein